MCPADINTPPGGCPEITLTFTSLCPWETGSQVLSHRSLSFLYGVAILCIYFYKKEFSWVFKLYINGFILYVFFCDLQFSPSILKFIHAVHVAVVLSCSLLSATLLCGRTCVHPFSRAYTLESFSMFCYYRQIRCTLSRAPPGARVQGPPGHLPRRGIGQL